MHNHLPLALVQMTASEDVAENIAMASGLIRAAARDGAALIATPEMTSLLTQSRTTLLATTKAETDDPALAAFRALSSTLQRWLLIGSLPIRVAAQAVVNRSFLLAPDGAIAARYDKIHMFDVDLPDGESYRESRLYRPGEAAVVAPTPWGLVGLTICYDLRFAGLYRHLAQAGARAIAVPAAFTRQTGAAHWHVLMRARAIETGCFIFAPAQTGRHPSNRETYGHSLIVSPWGEVIADGGEAVGLVQATLDLAEVDAARQRIPALRHERQFTAAAP
ncbi:MAG: carbon-nitrogen hydrolase family protein [Pseudomonadota bacterium]